MRISWKWRVTLIGCTACLCAVCLLNASWLAASPNGTPRLVAQRGVAQTYTLDSLNTDETCTARSIKPPTHDYIDNTIPSIEAALSARADVIEIDVRMTRDQRFVLFHDNALDCRTNGSGPISQHDLADLRRLDAKPVADIWTARAAQECGVGYLEAGWYGRVPTACEDGVIIVPIQQAHLFWGWPNRFLSRMRAHRTRVMVIGTLTRISSGMFSRLDTPEELAELPPGFDGLIWTDRISVIGPLVHN